MKQVLFSKQQQLTELMRTLDVVSPLATLNRGYAIVSNQSKEIIRSLKQVKPQEKLTLRITDGLLDCNVESITNNS